MSIQLDKAQVPKMSRAFYQLLEQQLQSLATKEANAIMLNFRDPDYSAENGGYHPVEVRLEKQQDLWRLVYVTDFAYHGHPYPELVKDIDICFNSKQVYSLFSGWIGELESRELVSMFSENFIAYQEMGAYTVYIQLD
ncbi:DUF2787 domain-containing protein [Shewanella sp. D64]|uniref:DUF2787 domain-containing protein n=1 Tax=unclassified Shewanella TaxID=196818 RepID=UPI0022BA5F4F|nr:MULTISPECIES: DUF2787 domain-containing protein [unclassified Shewanella]MEC4727875.1 DUF2787 domain-containing protein [Shewanella sp. D64]MEC4739917.1 DUF2787 domain-containing protein [Shewanella sp. E94]WBJ97118.1 DUF2787 domain-containing protein [Shewanella sp. MTB7]